MVLLEKLWDDVVAGPQPERGLGKLRKLTTKPVVIVKGRGRGEQQVPAVDVDAGEPRDAGDPDDADDARGGSGEEGERVEERVPPGEQPGDQVHGGPALRQAHAQLPHRLRLALQRRHQEQAPLRTLVATNPVSLVGFVNIVVLPSFLSRRFHALYGPIYRSCTRGSFV
ncbi:hypothetical protein EUGRSUZ_E03257 [Eucalyptus grandis]|uniref:Uncharacterized protein n=2 Tax=Eucalyptus grandis TaxID=71139 RepID=A0ACC3L0L6_EUCGR|nr:hypothetical protein EUGRSUZ_E03257 [Eucalyptus grandis]